jgi:hypothetical protein
VTGPLITILAGGQGVGRAVFSSLLHAHAWQIHLLVVVRPSSFLAVSDHLLPDPRGHPSCHVALSIFEAGSTCGVFLMV